MEAIRLALDKARDLGLQGRDVGGTENTGLEGVLEFREEEAFHHEAMVGVPQRGSANLLEKALNISKECSKVRLGVESHVDVNTKVFVGG